MAGWIGVLASAPPRAVASSRKPPSASSTTMVATVRSATRGRSARIAWATRAGIADISATPTTTLFAKNKNYPSIHVRHTGNPTPRREQSRHDHDRPATDPGPPDAPGPRPAAGRVRHQPPAAVRLPRPGRPAALRCGPTGPPRGGPAR